MKNEKEQLDDEKTLIENNENTEQNDTADEQTENTPKAKRTIDKEKAMMLAGGGLLAGTGYVSGANLDDEIMLDTNNDGIADSVLVDENADGTYNLTTEVVEIEADATEQSTASAFNPDTAQHASEGTVTDDMSFAEAFEAARDELGPGGIFEWQGHEYTTFYAEEVDESNNPIVAYGTVDADQNNAMTAQNDVVVENANSEVADANATEATTDEAVEVENVEDITDIIGADNVDTGEVVYDGEIAVDVPEDVDIAQLDDHTDDLLALNDDFDDMDDWA